MILCVSLNPAVDKRMRLERLQLGTVNRAHEVCPAPGGKAAHVAMVLKTLGAEPTWLGFAGGASGAALLNGLTKLLIRTITIPTAAETRTNLEIIAENSVTEILEPGSEITTSELSDLNSAVSRFLAETSAPVSVVLSGSLPKGAPADCYKTLIELAHKFGSRVFVDTGGEAFRLALSAKPDFVKPNRDEARVWSGHEVDGPASALAVLDSLLDSGAEAGAISLGSQGIVWRAAKEKALFARAPEISARSAVGSGDSALAAFVYADQQGMSPSDALRLGAACGAANCLADLPGQAWASDIARMKEQTLVEILH
jgi:1-phosphofructokinase family hexose kinase